MATAMLVLVLAVTPLLPAKAADRASQVLAEAKVATGGAAWDRIAGWHERGRHGDAVYDTHLDFHHYGSRFTNSHDGSTQIRGFNGFVVWNQDSNGSVSVSHDAAKLADARQSFYGSIFGFFFPKRFPAQLDYLGVKTQNGANFDVVRVAPEGATPMEVWVDRVTHYIVRFVDRSGPKPVTASLSDYRLLGGVLEPSRIAVSDGDPRHTKVGTVEDVALEPVQRAVFDPTPSAK